jgi:2'-5' RNA ligase
MDVSGQKMSTKKYFIAIVIPEPLYSEIESIKQELFQQHGLKGALRSPCHITLHRPFEWKEEREEELISKISDFRFDTSFTIKLNDFAFFEPRVIFVDVVKTEELSELHTLLKNHCKKNLHLFNEVDDMRGFHPHITVAFRDLKKPVFYQLKEKFEKRTISGEFEFTGFSLLKLEKRWEELQTF